MKQNNFELKQLFQYVLLLILYILMLEQQDKHRQQQDSLLMIGIDHNKTNFYKSNKRYETIQPKQPQHQNCLKYFIVTIIISLILILFYFQNLDQQDEIFKQFKMITDTTEEQVKIELSKLQEEQKKLIKQLSLDNQKRQNQSVDQLKMFTKDYKDYSDSIFQEIENSKALADTSKLIQANNQKIKEIDQKLVELQKMQQIAINQNLAQNFAVENQELTETQIKQNKIRVFIDQYPEKSYGKQNAQEFIIPKKIWLFHQKQNDLDFLQRLYVKNIKYFAKISGFEIKELNILNFKFFLNAKNKEKIEQVEKFLQERKSDLKTSIRYHKQTIVRRLALMMIIQEYGGVAIGEYLSLTQDLSWLKNIGNNWHCNHGNPGTKPQFFGFYFNDYGSRKAKQNKYFTYPVDKYMTIFPSLQPYFYAAVKGAEYVSDFISEMISALKQPLIVKSFINEQAIQTNQIPLDDMYYFSYPLASQLVLQKKQKQIDKMNIQGQYRRFAIDYYGFKAINCFFFALKMKHYFGNSQGDKVFQNIARIDIKQFEQAIGPMKYISIINPANEIRQLLQQAAQGKNQGILKGSFVQKIFFPQNDQKFLFQNLQIPFVKHQAKPWKTLPKILWIYWDVGFQKSPATNHLFVSNMKRKSGQSGFKVIFIDDVNAKDYLDQTTIKRIFSTIKNAKIPIYAQTKSDLFRLALLARHGGIYMDASYCLMENLDWLINIGQHPSEFIFNRFGDLPKVFMIFHPQFGSPYEWTIRKQYNTKQQWHLAYESNFIAAQANNELIKEWFDELITYIISPYELTSQRLNECGVANHKWTSKDNQYLVVMDAIKCIVGRRQIQMQKSRQKHYVDASDYYKIWSTSGYLGQQKLRQHTNYQKQSEYESVFIYRYSQQYVQSILGKFHHLAKLYNLNNRAMTQFLQKNLYKLEEQIHPHSIFANHLYNSKKQHLQIQKGLLVLKQIQ